VLSTHKSLLLTAAATSCSGALLQGVDSVLPPLSSGSKFHTVRVKKPTVVPASDSRGIRSLSVSWTVPNVTTDDPIGVAVWDTCSRTSYAVRRTRVSLLRPSLARRVVVFRKTGLLLFCRNKMRTEPSQDVSIHVHMQAVAICYKRTNYWVLALLQLIVS
jgi:hypothetical protein